MSRSWGLKDSDTCLSHRAGDEQVEIGGRVCEPIRQLGSKLWSKKQESGVWVQIPSLFLSTPQFRKQLDLSKVQSPHWKTRELVVESLSGLNRPCSSPGSLPPISYQLVPPSPSCWVMRLKFKQSMQNCPSSGEPPEGCTSSPLPGELPTD